jgi:hypothetical protein
MMRSPHCMIRGAMPHAAEVTSSSSPKRAAADGALGLLAGSPFIPCQIGDFRHVSHIEVAHPHAAVFHPG